MARWDATNQSGRAVASGGYFAVVQAMVCLGSFLYIVGLVLTDVSYTLFDPRVRLDA